MATLKHKTAKQVQQEDRESLIQQAKAECTRRIESEWDQIGQKNAALGIYSAEEKQACKDWIEHHRQKLQELMDVITSSDNLNIDPTNDKWWE